MKTKEILYLAIIASVGISLHMIEAVMPLPFIAPGAKLGLANIANLITLVIYGYQYAFIVVFVRCIVVLLGSGAVTGFFYSLSGALFSTLIMWVAYKKMTPGLSLIGVSVLGALGHNVAQLTVASLMTNNRLIFTYLPIMMLVSLFTGYFVGLTSMYISKHLENTLFIVEHRK